MKRRHFVGAAGAAAALATWPAFLRRAFGADPACKLDDPMADLPANDLIEVSAAFRRAAAARKPLLVFVIPEDASARIDRGHAFGELLNHGSDEDLAPLADVEVVCAPMAALRKIVPAAGKGEPLMVLVHADKLPATAKHLNADLPAYFRFPPPTPANPEEDPIERRIAMLGKLLRDGVGNHRGRLAARAGEARARLRDKAPRGTHWARSEGCGYTIENYAHNRRVGCGMAHVPEKSERFLYFFALGR